MAQLTDQGLQIDTVDQIEAEIKQSIWTNIDEQFDLSPESPDGQLVSIYAEREAKVQELALAVHNARRPDSASGTNLTQLSLITGTRRKTKTKTLVTSSVVNIDAGFSKAPGLMIAHANGDATKRFVNRDLVTNPGGSPANFTVVFEAETAGVVPVLAGQLTVIAEPLTGWNSITNTLDGVTGQADEQDPGLRLRRVQELQAQGSTTADAIRSGILRVLKDNVTHCRVLINESNAVDVNGLPAKSFEVIARGIVTDTNASIALANQIRTSKTGGMQASGTSFQVSTDSQGNSYVIGYTWVTPQNVYLELDVSIDPLTFPADGDAQLKNALVAVEAGYQPGGTVVAEYLKAQAFKVAGVTDAPALRLGFAASPVTTANLAIALRQIADLDTARIVVNHV
jgi:hypothetical protein